MATTHQYAPITHLTDEELRRLVREDPVRPGPSRYRVAVADNDLPIWPIIGTLKNVTGSSNPRDWPRRTLVQIADEWGLSLDSLAAAILYYKEHQWAIDGWLAENEAWSA